MEPLSDKKYTNIELGIMAFDKEDVRDFIKELKAKFPKTEGVHAFTGEQFHFGIDELAGEDLIWILNLDFV